MAYDADVTVTKVRPGEYAVDITETDVGTADSTIIGDGQGETIPRSGRIFRVRSVKSAGAASTLATVLSGSSSFTDATVALAATAAATVDTTSASGIPYVTTDGRLYHKATPDSGSNNAITTRYIIKESLA